MIDHPLPVGARVHHRGGIYSLSYGPYDLDRLQGGTYWGTVREVELGDDGEPRRYPDGSYEYRIESDFPLTPGREMERWWASYHIDRVYDPEEAK